ncbi:anti-sigma-D factor RsdA [Lolliginicoccus suaedae]|uniref:anti-sigma-D factor RsdA n=1 Tax=Lolliginicoccus suaedae TaxID=2605429 RepID=UPI0011EDDFC3|nr:anti-sigma-D factor RsdA [Lolliginicoccus suaedae]
MARRNDDGETGDRVGRDPEDLSQGAGEGGEASMPDIGELLADDAFLDALARGIEQDADSEETAALAGLLGDWRNDIMSAPLPPAPSLDEVEAAMQRAAAPATVASIRPGQGGGNRRNRWLTSVAGVAAAAAVVLGGLAVVSQNAQPGDPLWGFRQQIHGSSETTVMVAGLWDELQQAERALESGDVAQVQRILSEVAPRIGQLQGSDQDTLSSKFQQLSEDLQQNPGNLDQVLDMPRPAVPGATSDEETSEPPLGQLPTEAVIPGLPTDLPAGFPTELPTGVPTGVPLPDFTVDPEILSNFPWYPGADASATEGASQPPATTTTGQGGTSTAPTTTGSSSTTTGGTSTTTGASSAPSTTTSARPTSPRASATTAAAPVPEETQEKLDDVTTSTSNAGIEGSEDQATTSGSSDASGPSDS